jgi:hypothetical protein
MRLRRVSGKDEKLSINKGIEVMLPKSRRVEEPSWLNRTFHVLSWSVHVKIDIHRRK